MKKIHGNCRFFESDPEDPKNEGICKLHGIFIDPATEFDCKFFKPVYSHSMEDLINFSIKQSMENAAFWIALNAMIDQIDKMAERIITLEAQVKRISKNSADQIKRAVMK